MKHTATHKLDGISWQHVSKLSQARKEHRNSQAEWNFMAACQQIKSSPQSTQQLTPWMGMSACQQIKSSSQSTQQLTCWMGFHGNVSNSDQAHKVHSNSLARWDGISWQHVSKSNQAHKAHSNSLARWDGISWQNVSKSNQAHKTHSNSLAGWDFMAECQQIKSNLQNTQQLTP